VRARSARTSPKGRRGSRRPLRARACPALPSCLPARPGRRRGEAPTALLRADDPSCATRCPPGASWLQHYYYNRSLTAQSDEFRSRTRSTPCAGQPRAGRSQKMSQSLKSVNVITLFVEDPLRSKEFYERIFDVAGVDEGHGTVIFQFDNLFLRLLQRGEAES